MKEKQKKERKNQRKKQEHSACSAHSQKNLAHTVELAEESSSLLYRQKTDFSAQELAELQRKVERWQAEARISRLFSQNGKGFTGIEKVDGENPGEEEEGEEE